MVTTWMRYTPPQALWITDPVLALLPMYRAVRLHAHPAQVRKSWWLPGTQAQRGGTIWLRTYYPSLYRRLTELVPLFSTTA